MPPPYVQPHWDEFLRHPYNPQGRVGKIPSEWEETAKLDDLANALGGYELPHVQLTREELLRICRDKRFPVLYKYICVMAWGGQNYRNARLAWQSRNGIADALNQLIDPNVNHSRCIDYNLFSDGPYPRFPGLGPSYFTKLLYFFSSERGNYIMDRWSSQSINLLTGRPIVRLNRKGDLYHNTCRNYEEYCEELDNIAEYLRLHGYPNISGADVEQMLFAGVHHPWREYVRGNYHWAN